jgi:hypothetical protein
MKKIGLSVKILTVVLCFTIRSSFVFGNDKSLEINGVVFEDTNDNLKLDPGEKGIPDILVSNQHEIFKTNKKGQYTLPISNDETIIYVIKPADFDVPLNEYNLPQFYYIHKPEGSPDLEYGGIKPTGTLPEELNFPLHKASPDDTFKVIVMADPQTRTIEEVNYLRDDLTAELIGTEALFSIALGDIMFDDLSLFDSYNATMSMIDIPMYNVPGNHDFDHYPDTNYHTLETFKQHYGPDYYAFEYGKVSFIVLNSVTWLQDNQEGYGRYKGGIDSDQLQWLESYLEFLPDEQLLVFCTHVPFHSLNSSEPPEYIWNRKDLFNLIKNRQHLLAINGHLHALENFYLNGSMGWTFPTSFQLISCTAAAGGWWKGISDERGIPSALQLKDGTPNGYHVFSFSGNTYEQTYKAASKSTDYQIRISFPKGTISKEEIDSALIVANFFNGNDLSNVQYLIDNNLPLLMSRKRMKDPFAERNFAEHKEIYYNWESVGISNHIWTSKLPVDLKAGMHKIIVQGTDEYGNEYRQTAIFKVR